MSSQEENVNVYESPFTLLTHNYSHTNQRMEFKENNSLNFPMGEQ